MICWRIYGLYGDYSGLHVDDVLENYYMDYGDYSGSYVDDMVENNYMDYMVIIADHMWMICWNIIIW